MTDTAAPAIKHYWEDLPVDTTIDLGSLTVDRDEVLEFAVLASHRICTQRTGIR